MYISFHSFDTFLSAYLSSSESEPAPTTKPLLLFDEMKRILSYIYTPITIQFSSTPVLDSDYSITPNDICFIKRLEVNRMNKITPNIILLIVIKGNSTDISI